MADTRAAYLNRFRQTLDHRTAYQRRLEQAMSDAEAEPGFPLDAMDRRTSRTLLMSEDAQCVLTTIWKEGDCVARGTLEQAGMMRLFDSGEISAHAMALRLLPALRENDPAQLTALQRRIEHIVRAGVAYDLLERVEINRVRKPIYATDLLDRVFCDLGENSTGMEIKPPVSTIDARISHAVEGAVEVILELPETMSWSHDEAQIAFEKAIRQIVAKQTGAPSDWVLQVRWRDAEDERPMGAAKSTARQQDEAVPLNLLSILL